MPPIHRWVRSSSSQVSWSGPSPRASRVHDAGGFAEAILAGGDGEALEADEPFIALASIIIAGLDTTVHMIGNGVAALAAHRDQLDLLLAAPAERSPAVVEETLRYDAPVRFFLRRTDDGR